MTELVHSHILSVLILLPIAGAALVAASWRNAELVRNFTLGISVVVLAFTCLALTWLDRDFGGLQLIERSQWIPELGITYSLGVDGISLPLIGMVALVAVVSVLSGYRRITERVMEFHALTLLVEGAAIGFLCAADLVLLYLFWEILLLGVFWFTGIWGGQDTKRTALRLVSGWLPGSVLILTCIVILGLSYRVQIGVPSFALVDMLAALRLPAGAQSWLFGLCAVGCLTRMPVFPFHSWIRDTYCEAPPQVSAFVSGFLSAVGAYTLLRVCFALFPLAVPGFSLVLLILAVLSLVYGALSASRASDLRGMASSLSVSQCGLILLAVSSMTTAGMQGTVLLAVASGLSVAGLLLAADLVDSRLRAHRVGDLTMLRRTAPALWWIPFFFVLAASSAPGTAGFAGVVYAALGVLHGGRAWAVLLAPCIVLPAVFLHRRIASVPTRTEVDAFGTLSPRDKLVLVPLVALLLAIGLYPQPVLDIVRPAAMVLEAGIAHGDRSRLPLIVRRPSVDRVTHIGTAPCAFRVMSTGGLPRE